MEHRSIVIFDSNQLLVSRILYHGKGDATHRIFYAVILLMMLRSDNILVNSHGNSDHNILDTTFQPQHKYPFRVFHRSNCGKK